MKLIIRNGFIDLEAPVYMSESQREKFIDFMKNTFDDVDIREVQEKSRPGPQGGEQRKWTVDDISVLLDDSSIEKKAETLDRSEMSVIMRTGNVVPQITKWMKEKGYVEYPPAKKLVEEFMREVGML
jgi:rhodanese-related sulfurtransferase